MSAVTSTRIVLASRPHGEPTADNFRTETVDLPALQDGQVLLRTVYLSLDPYMRGRMSAAKSYAAPVEVGDVMVGGTVRRWSSPGTRGLEPGAYVLAYSGWQYARRGRTATRCGILDPYRAPLSTALGVLGMPGFTAYAGLLEIGAPAAGGDRRGRGRHGSGRVGRRSDREDQGRAGRRHRRRPGQVRVRCATEFGFDAAIDHRAPDFAEQLTAAVPDGIDVYFENVGGAVAAAVLPLLNLYAPSPGVRAGRQLQRRCRAGGARPAARLHGAGARQSLTVRGFIQCEFVRRRTRTSSATSPGGSDEGR